MSEMEVTGPVRGRHTEILTGEALAFLAALQREFNPVRERLLAERARRQERILAGEMPGFLPGTAALREGTWRVAETPPDLADRRVEITGPTDRKMMINALNSGAHVFMADFEDSNSPHWDNMVSGQVNLLDAVEGVVSFTSPQGKRYRLEDETAVLVVRPRGWHLTERHLRVDERAISASLFDFGLYFFHNARRLLERGSGPYFYLPKLESHHEARLWNDIFCFSQDALGIPRATIKATVLVETILAAFEMDEILYELADHVVGLNAGRWDYIFSFIKKFRHRPDFVLPDRAEVTMTVPFMHAYSELLVRTCHRRGAHAMGGMSAFVPSRRDRQVNETAFAQVREDKAREASQGFDGTWVAHPDLVPVALDPFNEVLGNRPHQRERARDDVVVSADQLLDVSVPGGRITEAGLRNNVGVALRYLSSWLAGSGAAAIFHLMEDVATAEIARSQVWQWISQGARLEDGRTLRRDLVGQIEEEEAERIRQDASEGAVPAGRLEEARGLFRRVCLAEDFVEFITVPGYELLD
ncbi:MAG: malate synthase A [Actinomycetota bacterium]